MNIMQMICMDGKSYNIRCIDETTSYFSKEIKCYSIKTRYTPSSPKSKKERWQDVHSLGQDVYVHGQYVHVRCTEPNHQAAHWFWTADYNKRMPKL